MIWLRVAQCCVYRNRRAQLCCMWGAGFSSCARCAAGNAEADECMPYHGALPCTAIIWIRPAKWVGVPVGAYGCTYCAPISCSMRLVNPIGLGLMRLPRRLVLDATIQATSGAPDLGAWRML